MDNYLETVSHSENQFRKEQGWDDKFVVMYSGNHSLVHPLDTILGRQVDHLIALYHYLTGLGMSDRCGGQPPVNALG